MELNYNFNQLLNAINNINNQKGRENNGHERNNHKNTWASMNTSKTSIPVNASNGTDVIKELFRNYDSSCLTCASTPQGAAASSSFPCSRFHQVQHRPFFLQNQQEIHSNLTIKYGNFVSPLTSLLYSSITSSMYAPTHSTSHYTPTVTTVFPLNTTSTYSAYPNIASTVPPPTMYPPYEYIESARISYESQFGCSTDTPRRAPTARMINGCPETIVENSTTLIYTSIKLGNNLVDHSLADVNEAGQDLIVPSFGESPELQKMNVEISTAEVEIIKDEIVREDTKGSIEDDDECIIVVNDFEPMMVAYPEVDPHDEYNVNYNISLNYTRSGYRNDEKIEVISQAEVDFFEELKKEEVIPGKPPTPRDNKEKSYEELQNYFLYLGLQIYRALKTSIITIQYPLSLKEMCPCLIYNTNYNAYPMISCDECLQWYHMSCIKMSTTEADSFTNYKCPRCNGEKYPAFGMLQRICQKNNIELIPDLSLQTIIPFDNDTLIGNKITDEGNVDKIYQIISERQCFAPIKYGCQKRILAAQKILAGRPIMGIRANMMEVFSEFPIGLSDTFVVTEIQKKQYYLFWKQRDLDLVNQIHYCCRYNASIKHAIVEGKLYLYVEALTDIEIDEEITFDAYDYCSNVEERFSFCANDFDKHKCSNPSCPFVSDFQLGGFERGVTKFYNQPKKSRKRKFNEVEALLRSARHF